MTEVLSGNYAPIPEELLINPRGTYSAIRLNSSGMAAAAIYKIPESGTITGVSFRVQNFLSSGTLNVGFYTVDATGLPTATAYGGMTGTTVSVTGNNTYSATLATPVTGTAGDLVAVVLELTTASDFRISCNYISVASYSFPYSATYNGSWAKTAYAPSVAVQYSGDVYHYTTGLLAASNYTTTAVNTGTTPDELGNWFNFPYGMTIYAAYVSATVASSADFNVVLYDSAGSVLATQSQTAAQLSSNSTQVSIAVHFSESVELSANTDYYLMVSPTTANSVTVHSYVYPSDAARGQSIAGLQMKRANRTDAGEFSLTDANVASVFPMFESVMTTTGSPRCTGRALWF